MPDGTQQCPQTPPKWTCDRSQANLNPPFAHMEVKQNAMEAQRINGEASLITDTIEPASDSAAVAFFVIQGQDLHPSDSIVLSYKKDTGSWTAFEKRGGSFSLDTVATPVIRERTLLRATIEQGMQGGGPNRERKHRVEQVRALQINDFFDVTIEADPEGAICPGECVQLTATSDFNYDNYAWSPPNSLNNINGNTAEACPQSTTQYQVIATGTIIIDIWGSTITIPVSNTAKYTVEVLPAPDINVSNVQYPGGGNSICLEPGSDDCATFTVTTGSLTFFSVSPDPENITPLAPFTYEVEACPDQTTTYTITASNPFLECDRTVEVTVNVEDCRCNMDVSQCSNFSGNSTDISALSCFGGNNTLASQNFEVPADHTLYIDANAVIEGSKFKMGARSQVVVEQGNTLTITDQGGTPSQFFSCTELWQGVLVKGDGKLIMNANSIIEDAQKGIHLDTAIGGGTPADLTLENARLNKNVTHVITSSTGPSDQHDLDISGTEFTCKPLYSPGVTLLPPREKEVTKYGILLNGNAGTTVDIGEPSKSENVFEGLTYGIHARGASFRARNNVFRFIRGLGPSTTLLPEDFPYDVGIAILGHHGPLSLAMPTNYTYNPSVAKAFIGGPQDGEGNTFLNCKRAVRTVDYKRVQVKGNFIDRSFEHIDSIPSYYPDPSGFGFWSNWFLYQNQLPSSLGGSGITAQSTDSLPTPIDYDYNNNKILDQDRGIEVFFEEEPSSGDLDIKGNRFRNPDFGAQMSFDNQRISKSSIQVYASVPASTGSQELWSIRDNDIADTREGILLRTLHSDKKEVSENTIVIDPLPNDIYPPGDNLDYVINRTNAGIRTVNVSRVTVRGNSISSTIDPQEDGSAGINDRGVYSELSSEQGITCNKVFKIGDAFMFFNQNQQTKWAGNEIGKVGQGTYHQGLTLTDGGYIGTQGSPTSPKEASANVWNTDPIGPFNVHQTWTQHNTAGTPPAELVVNPGPNSTPTTEPFNNGNESAPPSNPVQVNAFSTPQPQVVNCPESAGIRKQENVRDSMLRRVAAGNLNYAYSQGGKWWATWQAYRIIERDSSLPGTDSLLTAFRDSVHQANIGSCRKVDREREIGNTTQAQSTNSSIVCGTPWDSTFKAFNTIYFDSWGNNDTLTASQKADLRTLADQCPITHGPGVYRSRAMVQAFTDSLIRFENRCKPPRPEGERMASEDEDSEAKASVHPNPARDRAVLDYELPEGSQGAVLILRDLNGRSLERLPLEGRRGRRSLDLSGLQNGLLFYEIRKDGERIEHGKLMHLR